MQSDFGALTTHRYSMAQLLLAKHAESGAMQMEAQLVRLVSLAYCRQAPAPLVEVLDSLLTMRQGNQTPEKLQVVALSVNSDHALIDVNVVEAATQQHRLAAPQ